MDVIRRRLSDLLLILAAALVLFGWLMTLGDPPILMFLGTIVVYSAWALAIVGVLLWPTVRRVAFGAGVVTFMFLYIGAVILLGLAATVVRERRSGVESR